MSRQIKNLAADIYAWIETRELVTIDEIIERFRDHPHLHNKSFGARETCVRRIMRNNACFSVDRQNRRGQPMLISTRGRQ